MSSNSSIQVFRPTFRVDECLDEIRQCLEMGWSGMGFKTVELEKAWCEYTGLPHSHFLGSATAGLHLAIKILAKKHGWQEGDEVITTPLTFVSTNHAIMYERFSPVFADIDEHLCLDPESIESRITPRTKAVMFVGLGGNTGRLKEVQELCQRRGLSLILDAAHMAGTRLDGEHVGKQAEVSVFSFQAVKNLPTADSGMICFSSEEDDQAVRKWTWLGINKDTFARTVVQGSYKWYYDVEEVGFKYHGNSIMASLGLVGLKYLDRDNAYRRQMATWYKELLCEREDVRFIPMGPGCETSQHLFQLLINNRDEVVSQLASNGIHPGVHYRDNTEYDMYAYGNGTCPNATKVSASTISLPLHMGLKRSDIELVAKTLSSILNAYQVSPRAICA